MRLISFSVTNFRSITTANKIPVGDFTVLIGKNNEGKTNILSAFDIGYRLLLLSGRNPTINYINSIYNWETDFPTHLQNNSGKAAQSIFKMEFKLNEMEIEQFKQLTNSSINGNVEIEIRIGQNEIPTIKVMKRRSEKLNERVGIIGGYITRNFFYAYIPTIRTEANAMDVISEVLSFELKSLDNNLNYINAISEVKKYRQEIYDRLSPQITSTIKNFLPNVTNVRIVEREDRPRNSRIRYRHDYDVLINDRYETSIVNKGDGVKSLTALALLQNSYSFKESSLIAIEEPEAHLHPEAIHQLYDVLYNLTKTNQVMITTHNPSFVNRNNIKTNIIVSNGQASPAKSINQIRRELGIRISDNLINAENILVVEGLNDRTALLAILPTLSDKLRQKLDQNEFIIDALGSCDKLTYNLSLWSNLLCKYHVLLDNDEAGRNAKNNAANEGLLDNNYTLTNIRGKSNSEFEDCIKEDIYVDDLCQKYSLSKDLLRHPNVKANSKWSDRMKEFFLVNGKDWTDDLKMEIKNFVATKVRDNPNDAISKQNCFVESLVCSLEKLID